MSEPINKYKQLRNQKGMTLIEILIVLTIIAGLATMLFKGVFANFAKSQVQETKIMMGKVTQSLQLYYVDCQKYPTTIEGLTANTANECTNWVQPYMDKVPKDAWNHEFVYDSNGTSYTLKSLGRDGKEGGSGVDSDISSDDLEK